MAVIFAKNLTEINVQNPVRSNTHQLKKYQTLGRTASGNIYTYDKGINIKKLNLRFENLREDEKTALENFYDITIDGIMNTFDYTDHFGTTWTARFLNTELNFEEQDSVGKTETTFDVSGTPYPSTEWDEGVYNIDIELEVS